MWDYLPEAASSYAGEVDYIIEMVTYIVGAWLIACVILIFVFALVFRRKKGRPARYLPGTGKQIAWVLVPVAFVTLFDLGIEIVNIPVWAMIKEEIPETEQVVRVVGKQWLWEFTYPGPDGKFDTPDDITTVNVLHVKLNAKTKFELSAADVLHSLSIPAFRLKQDAVPGRVITGWFEPTKTGTYDIQCAELCGIGHKVMAARVKVHSAEDFERVMTAFSLSKDNEQVAANSGASNLSFGER